MLSEVYVCAYDSEAEKAGRTARQSASHSRTVACAAKSLVKPAAAAADTDVFTPALSATDERW